MHRLIEGCAQPASLELQPLVAGRRIFDRKQSTRQRRPWAKDFTHGSSRRPGALKRARELTSTSGGQTASESAGFKFQRLQEQN